MRSRTCSSEISAQPSRSPKQFFRPIILAISSMNVPLPAVHRPHCSGETSKYTVWVPSSLFFSISAKPAFISETILAASASLPSSLPSSSMDVYTPAISLASLTTTATPASSSCLTCSSVWAMLLITSTSGFSSRICSMLVLPPDSTLGTLNTSAG